MKWLASMVATIAVTGKCCAALLFNGTNAFVDCRDINAYDGQTQLGVMFWVYMDSGTTAFGSIVSDINLVSFDQGWAIQRDNVGSALRWLLCNGAVVTCSSAAGSFSTNAWHHVVINYDGSQTGDAARAKMYVDSVSQSLTFVGTVPASLGVNTQPLFLGTSNPASALALLKGYLDDVVLVAGRTFTDNERSIHFKSHVRRLVSCSSNWPLDGYADGSAVSNLPIVDTAGGQFAGMATNCVSVSSFLSYP